MRGTTKARDFLHSLDISYVSHVTIMELIKGSKDSHGIKEILKNLNQFEILYLTEHTQKLAFDLYKNLKLSGGIGLMDSYVAATALENKMILHTRNTKHFKSVNGLVFSTPY